MGVPDGIEHPVRSPKVDQYVSNTEEEDDDGHEFCGPGDRSSPFCLGDAEDRRDESSGMADPDEEDEVGDIDAPEDLSRQSGDGQSVPVLGDIGINPQDDEGSEDRNGDIESPSRLANGFKEGGIFTDDLLSLIHILLPFLE